MRHLRRYCGRTEWERRVGELPAEGDRHVYEVARLSEDGTTLIVESWSPYDCDVSGCYKLLLADIDWLREELQ